jgi:cobalamin biosynthesis Mg chelatase CobN
MPGVCHVCGMQPDVPNRCNHCDKPVCSEHLLPENHECVALKTRLSDEWFPDDRETPMIGAEGDVDAERDTTSPPSAQASSRSSTDTEVTRSGTAAASSSTGEAAKQSKAKQRTQSDLTRTQSTTSESDRRQTETKSAISRVASQLIGTMGSVAHTAWDFIQAGLRLVAIIAVWAASGWALWRGLTLGIQAGVLWRPLMVLVGSLALLRLTRK